MSQPGRADHTAVKSTVPRKIVVTLVTGGFAYLITALVQQSQIWPVVLGTFIGGIVLVVQFLADVDARLQMVELSQEGRLHAVHEIQRGHATEMEQLVRDGFLKINEATELFGLVETSALRTDVVTQFVKNATQIEPVPPLVFDFAQAEVFRMSKFLKELSAGEHVTYDGEDRDWLLGLAKHSRNSIDATSLTTVDASGAEPGSGGLWNTDLGHRYLEVQREAIRSGVTVRRVFILNQFEPSRYPNLHEICRMQRDLGIQVRILSAQEISGLLRNSLFDFIIFDDVISYEVTPGPRMEDNSGIMLSTHLILGEDRVRERIRRFRDLWECAVDFKD